MLLGGCKDKYRMAWRLLQSLKEGIERRSREHMNLIDNKDRVATLLWDDTHLLDKVTDIIHRVVRRSIQLMHIQRATLIERTT